MLNLGELATLVQERADVLLIVMNNNGYGMIRHIQHTRYGARYQLDELHTPDFQQLALALSLPSVVVRDAASFATALAVYGALRGPALIEVDMPAIGRFGGIFNTSQK
jgi:acetolactate synthase-1/2/3 large subunit